MVLHACMGVGGIEVNFDTLSQHLSREATKIETYGEVVLPKRIFHHNSYV